jgi:cytochrome c oxidase assembly factor CtaG
LAAAATAGVLYDATRGETPATPRSSAVVVLAGRPRTRRRLRLAVLASAAVAAVAAPAASAHTGELKTPVTAGPYRLVVTALPVPSGARPALAFRGLLADGRTGAAVAGARVAILVTEPSGAVRGPYRATGAGGDYQLLVPIADASAWRSLRFTIEVAGPLGAARGVYTPPDLFRQWLFEPWVLLGAAIAAALFLQGFVRLRRRGRRDHASWGRLALFGAGLGLSVLALVSPLDVVGDRFLLSAHMLQHVLIGDAGPALMLLGLRGPLLFFAVPPRLLRALGRARPLRKAAAWLLRPKVALPVWALAYGGWHIPAAYDYAASHQAVHDLEHASFALAGLLVWSLLIDPARRGHLSRARRLRVAGVLFLLGTAVSDTLIFSFRLLYPAYAHQPERVFSLSPLHDQQLAGLVMTIDQLLTLGTCAAILLWPLLRERPAPAPALAHREQPA